MEKEEILHLNKSRTNSKEKNVAFNEPIKQTFLFFICQYFYESIKHRAPEELNSVLIWKLSEYHCNRSHKRTD